MLTGLRVKFRKDFVDKRVTMLGAGPMSLRVTNAIINLANKYKLPISMIPSRRQVDALTLGGGYVNNWSTEKFAQYVRDKDVGGFVLLARDHSGPWQLSREANGGQLSHSEAMQEVQRSLEVDLAAGFDLIHIDSSPGLMMGRTRDQVEDDILDLLKFCQDIEIYPTEYEIGADEQSQVPDYVQVAEESLLRVLGKVRKAGLRAPLFYVLQTGTKVMESRNVGSFDSTLPVEGMLPTMVQLPEILQMCRRHNVYLKEHNADYLSNEALGWHRRLGIPAANVAPEFGVVETREILMIAEEVNAKSFIDNFSSVVLSSKKWEKWMVQGSKVNDREKVEIAGHYHFSDKRLEDEFAILSEIAAKKSVSFEERIGNVIEISINRYLHAFGYKTSSR